MNTSKHSTGAIIFWNGLVALSTTAVLVPDNQSKEARAEDKVPLVATTVDHPFEQSSAENTRRSFVPDWIADAVFYQIFPERFRNGDPANDPTIDSLETSRRVPDSWAVSPWTADWYSRAAWEKSMGKSFYASVYHRRYGGDLQGVIDKLDYLQELGVTAIYFNPIFHARSSHKYDATSLHHVDPYFGPDPTGDLKLIASETENPASWQWTAADRLFLELVQQLHRREMKLVIDGVFNHAGRDFFAFADLRQHQANSKYRDWYVVRKYDDPETSTDEFDYEGWWNSKSLPVFADNAAHDDLHPAPKKYVLRVTRRWMDPDGDRDPADGVDGWRLDVPNDVPTGFWAEWNRLVRELNPEAYTVGEYWHDAREQLLQGGFSATMNYHGFAYPVKGFLVDGRLAAHDFGRMLAERLQAYPPAMQLAMQNLIDSHDTDRVASMIVNASNSAERAYLDPDRFDYDAGQGVSPRHNRNYALRAPNERERAIQRLVALMQMTFVGPPMIYYGTEAGMWGADDPCDRQPMVWRDLNFEPQAADPLGRPRSPEPICFDEDLFRFYQEVVQLRRKHGALRRGDFAVVVADDAAQFFAFRRRLGDSTLLIAINRKETPYHWRVTSPDKRNLTTLFSTGGSREEIGIDRDDGHFVVTIPPLEGVVLVQSSRE